MPIRAIPRHACKYRNRVRGHAVGETSADLVGPDGFAAIPTTALDPAHRPASPAVPALVGSGSPSVLAALAIPPQLVERRTSR